MQSRCTASACLAILDCKINFLSSIRHKLQFHHVIKSHEWLQFPRGKYFPCRNALARCDAFFCILWLHAMCGCVSTHTYTHTATEPKIHLVREGRGGGGTETVWNKRGREQPWWRDGRTGRASFLPLSLSAARCHPEHEHFFNHGRRKPSRARVSHCSRLLASCKNPAQS